MKPMTIAASVAAVLVSTGAAMAVPVTGTPVPMPVASGHRTQYQSNQNLRYVQSRITRAIDALQNDASDYGGRKERAVDLLSAARGDLQKALAYWQSHGHPPTTYAAGAPIGKPIGENAVPGENGEAGDEMGQSGSNANIRLVRRNIEAAIDALQADDSDYGGYRELAVDKLRQARAQMEAALDFVGQPGVRNGGSGQIVSDANLRYVKEHVETAIGRLQDDRSDYGGHRAAAVADLRQADGYLDSALSYDSAHERFNAAATAVAGATTGAPVGKPIAGGAVQPTAAMPGEQISQGRSNDSLGDARQHLEWAIDALQRDAHDYGGFRAKAVQSLQAARAEIAAALAFRRTH